MRRVQQLDWYELDGLGNRGLRGGALLAGGSWVRFALQLGTSIVLARILGPSEYGLAAILIIFGAASELLRDSGAATLITQARELEQKHATSLFWRSVTAGAIAAVVVAVLGIPLSLVFNEPRFVYFAPLMATMFLMTGTAAIPGAVLARNLRFGPGALSDAAGAVAGTVVGVIAAVQGAGALALVLQSVTFVAVQSLTVWMLCPWRPNGPRSAVSMRGHRQEATNLMTVQVLNYAVSNIDNLLVGLVGGLRDAGLYNQAFRLMVLPLQQVLGPVRRAILPVMSVVKADPERYRQLYRTLVLCSAFVLWSLFTIGFVEAPALIRLVFGEAWVGAAPIFRILVLSGMTQVLGYTTTWLFIASRQPRLFTTWSLASRPLFVVAFLIGLPWGATGVALGYSIACLALVVPEFLLAARTSPLVLGDLARPLLWPSVSVVGVLAVGAATQAWLGGQGLGELAVRLLLELAVPVLLVLLVPALRATSREVVRLSARDGGAAAQVVRS